MDLNDLELYPRTYPVPDEIDGIPVSEFFGCHVAPMFWLKDQRQGPATARWPEPYAPDDLDVTWMD